MPYNQSHESLRIGVIGYSGQRFDEAVARTELLPLLAEQVENPEFEIRTVEVVSELANLGIPKKQLIVLNTGRSVFSDFLKSESLKFTTHMLKSLKFRG